MSDQSILQGIKSAEISDKSTFKEVEVRRSGFASIPKSRFYSDPKVQQILEKAKRIKVSNK